WTAGPLVPDVRLPGTRQGDPHCRGSRRRRHAAPVAAELHHPSRPAMRVLHARLSHAGGRRAGGRTRPERRRRHRDDFIEPVPLHRVSEHHQGRARRASRHAFATTLRTQLTDGWTAPASLTKKENALGYPGAFFCSADRDGTALAVLDQKRYVVG